ncbi:MAG: hypothetical protein KA204_00200 [Chromatiaceae bacterium]|nr:hypothetical protein [Chromatiaceae bacterium]MBP8197231.1 hypothetical protein [Chromatiaceae bacterium]
MTTNTDYLPPLPLEIQIPERIIDRHRYDETDWSWWQWEAEDFAQVLTTQGIDVAPKLKGLQFDLYQRVLDFPCYIQDWKLFLEYQDAVDEFPTVLRHFAYGNGENIVAKYDPQYRTVEIQTYNVTFQFTDGIDPATAALLDTWLFEEISTLEQYVKDVLKDRFHELLETLDAEYEGLTSDEYVADNLRQRYDTDELVEEIMLANEPLVFKATYIPQQDAHHAPH